VTEPEWAWHAESRRPRLFNLKSESLSGGSRAGPTPSRAESESRQLQAIIARAAAPGGPRRGRAPMPGTLRLKAPGY
jgi:hypothetical protein